MAGSTSSRITEHSAQILRLLLSFSYASREHSFLNNWTLEGDIKEGNSISSSLPRHGARIKEQEHIAKKWEKETNKTKGKLQVSTKKNIEQEELYDAWTD